jgi:L-asparaginase
MSVVIISTGGTIAATEDDGGDASPELSGGEIAASVPGLQSLTEIETDDFSTVPSPHFTIEQMYDLVVKIRDLDRNSDVEGIVVTQGTDILEESAYFVSLCYDGSTPVAFTGAMRGPSLASPDGPVNVLDSVRTTLNCAETTANVFVVFNNRIHPARSVTKTHSMAVDTFRSPEFGPLGFVEEDRVVWRRGQVGSAETFDPTPERLTNDVHAVTITADTPPGQIHAAAEADGLCVAALGVGHVPQTLVEPLRDLTEIGVAVVATTRCPEGRVARHTYDFPGSEQTIRDDLSIPVSDRNLQKTRIKTIVALAAGSFETAFS